MPWTTRIDKPELPMAFSDDKIRLVWCTDVQVADAETASQVVAMDRAINDCNEWRPNAFICTGDVANTARDQARRFFYHVWRCQRPAYICTGNHDESEYAPGSYGNPADISDETLMDRAAPYYYSQVLESGDGTAKALCLFLDSFYDDDPDGGEPGNSEYHDPGDRIGTSDITPAGGYWRRLGAAQLAWIEATLAASAADFVLVFLHYAPGTGVNYTDKALLADKLQADGRPAIGLCGHIHPNATSYTLTSTDTLASYTFYKCPAMFESSSWTRVTLGWNGSAITLDGMVIYNYTDPGSWTIAAPFTLAG